MRKHAVLVSIVIYLGIFFAASNGLAETAPEFDGAYLKTADGNYTEIKTTKAFRTGVAHQGQNLMEVLGMSLDPYVVDKSSMQTFATSSFKGFLIKGKYTFESFSLHPLIERILKSNEVFYENHGPAERDKPFYVPGNQFELRKKAVGDDAYYFEPREQLEKGDYVGWIGDDLWLFRLE